MLVSRALWISIALTFVLSHATHPLAGAVETAGTRIWALEYGVSDLEKAAGFYTGALGYRIEEKDAPSGSLRLRNGDSRLVLVRTAVPVAPPEMARVYLNMSVGDLDRALRTVLDHGGRAPDPTPRDSAVGPFLEVSDPSGNPVHLIDPPFDTMEPGDPPVVFNIGFHVREMAAAESFFTSLGFGVSTRDYLPETLVFERQGSGYFVIHPLAERPASGTFSAGALLIEMDAMEATLGDLPAGSSSTASGGTVTTLRGPSGNLIKIRGPVRANRTASE